MPADATVQTLLDSKERQIHSIGPDATVFDALKVLSEAKIGALPVLEAGKLVGMFSERDYARRVILEGRASKDTKVQDIMTTNVRFATPDLPVRECMAMMNAHRFRHLPVLKDGELIGIVSIGDVVRAIIMSLL